MNANTHAVANVGAGGIAASIAALVVVFTNPEVLVGLMRHDPTSIAQVVAPLLGVAFSAAATYFGRPLTVPADPAKGS